MTDLKIEEKRVVLVIMNIVHVSENILDGYVGNLIKNKNEIVDAIDFLINGF